MAGNVRLLDSRCFIPLELSEEIPDAASSSVLSGMDADALVSVSSTIDISPDAKRSHARMPCVIILASLSCRCSRQLSSALFA
eukprot:329498-Amorphochlora_amoeboformis.AAC.1